MPFLKLSFPKAPIIVLIGLPSLKIIKDGILITEYFEGLSGLSSTFIFPTFNLPSYSVANSSTIGVTILHGAHHGAQKSTKTGVSDFKTSDSKFWSVKFKSAMCLIKISKNEWVGQGVIPALRA
jgi:hypothetical protein